ncbi:hypothetical protein WICMUC_003246 [Wickerhamomyces mucosus]|uniref:Pre-mRNA-processing factor 17 n=1 Tax=Wickerhamomyces mucosus TaxID=1378264 RepID=A0A9P8PN16_9ASCO|nr:hypothetical protein WICMUC_003246 [Wickerhamomyces mucosus]
MGLISGYSSSEDESSEIILAQSKSKEIIVNPRIEKKLSHDNVSKSSIIPSKDITKNTTNLIQTNAGETYYEAIDDLEFERQIRKESSRKKREIDALNGNLNPKRKKREKGSAVDDIEQFLGPWAKFDKEEELPVKDMGEDLLKPDELEETEALERLEESEEQGESEDDETQETTEFLGSQKFDYQGRSYMYIPTDADVNLTNDSKPDICFVPKRQIHKWNGHISGTNKIEFFPKSNHLLLSCGNDCKIYLWSVYHKRELLRGYYGHTQPIRDINFNNDGTKFLSTSYDKFVKVWDTETGQCLTKFKLKSVGNCIKFNPFNDDEFVVGLMNHKIEHYSISKHQLIQTYDYHLGSINSITFLPTKQFISSSEDKTIRIWDISINIAVKLISDPTLHSIPVTRVHPEKNYFAGQSMDNTILVFSAKGKFKTNKKKIFKGHNCAGYGIGIDFSPDGKNLVSGDSKGNVFFWDWKTTKLVKKIKVSDRAITQVVWNTKEVSKVAVTGADGSIYYYE